jgi:hypothetical protein
VIQYQFDGNPHLVYELLRHEKAIVMLDSLTLTQLLQMRADVLEKRKEVTPASAEGPATNDKGKQPANDLPQYDEGWFVTWHSQLPLKAIQTMLEALAPQVKKLSDDQGLVDESSAFLFQSMR